MPKRPRRGLTEAERDARRQADRERIEQAACALPTSEGWRRWIRVRAANGLSRYSLRNQWLIACECHARGITPTYVAGFRAFLALNRCLSPSSNATTTARRPARSGFSSEPSRSLTRYLVIVLEASGQDGTPVLLPGSTADKVGNSQSGWCARSEARMAE